MAKHTELNTRLSAIAKSHGITAKDFLSAMVDFAEGNITATQVKSTDFLKENYFTPSTYKLFAEFNSLVMQGNTKAKALKMLKVKYTRCTKAQFNAVAKL